MLHLGTPIVYTSRESAMRRLACSLNLNWQLPICVQRASKEAPDFWHSLSAFSSDILAFGAPASPAAAAQPREEQQPDEATPPVSSPKPGGSQASAGSGRGAHERQRQGRHQQPAGEPPPVGAALADAPSDASAHTPAPQVRRKRVQYALQSGFSGEFRVSACCKV